MAPGTPTTRADKITNVGQASALPYPVWRQSTSQILYYGAAWALAGVKNLAGGFSGIWPGRKIHRRAYRFLATTLPAGDEKSICLLFPRRHIPPEPGRA